MTSQMKNMDIFKLRAKKKKQKGKKRNKKENIYQKKQKSKT